MFKPAATLVAAALSAAIALPAAAGTAGREEASMLVSYADLDLGSEAGQAALDRRLRSAAKQVCDYAASRSLATMQDSARCYRQARRDVQVQFAGVVAERTQRGG